jgi:hypothetical protein
VVMAATVHRAMVAIARRAMAALVEPLAMEEVVVMGAGTLPAAADIPMAEVVAIRAAGTPAAVADTPVVAIPAAAAIRAEVIARTGNW